MKKRLVSLLLAFSMMLTFLPAGAVTAFADDGTFSDEILNYTVISETEKTAKVSGVVDKSTLTEAVIPDECKGYKITEIGEAAFSGCNALESVTIGANVETIGEYAFSSQTRDCYDTALKTVVFAPGSCLKEIGKRAFSHSGLTALELPETLETIGVCAFIDTQLTKIEIPAEVTTLEDAAFSDCANLEKVEFKGNKVTKLMGTFQYCSKLKEVQWPTSLQEMGQYVLMQCGALEELDFRNLKELKKIGPLLTMQCVNLKRVYLPAKWEDLDRMMVAEPIPPYANMKHVTVYYAGSEQEFRETVAKGSETLGPTNYFYRVGDANGPQKYFGFYEVVCSEYAVTFENDDGSEYAKQALFAGDTFATVKKPTDPAKSGYTFKGWKVKDSDPAEMFEDIDTTKELTSGMTFVPVWEEIPTVEITVPNNVTVKVGDNEVTPDENGKISVEKGKEVTLTAKDNDAKNTYEWTKNGTKLDDVTGASYTFTADADSDGMTIALKVTKPADPVKPTKPYTIKVVDGTVNGQSEVSVDATDKVTLKPGEAPDGMTFQYWDIPQELMDELSKEGKGTFDNKDPNLSFPMPKLADTTKTLTIKAMFGTPDTVDEGPSVLGTAATVAVGAAAVGILGWQAYSLASQSYLELFLPYVPSNRAELAMLLWEDAGKPELTVDNYTDVEADKTDLQKATHWAVAEGLMDEADPEDERVFAPNNGVSKWTIIKAWNKAQKLKKG